MENWKSITADVLVKYLRLRGERANVALEEAKIIVTSQKSAFPSIWNLN